MFFFNCILLFSCLFLLCASEIENEDEVILLVLEEIHELGYISLFEGKILQAIPPIDNVFHFYEPWERWTGLIKYFTAYAETHKQLQQRFFVCLYDGWGEYSQPIRESDRVYLRWTDFTAELKAEFSAKGSVGEPRFRHSLMNPTIYPIFPLPILTYNRHIGDKTTLLMPDAHFLDDNKNASVLLFSDFTTQVDLHDVAWEQKVEKAAWRGVRHVDDGYAIYNEGLLSEKMHHRDMAVLYSQHRLLSPPDFLDASFEHQPVSWLLQHKYLLDIDGMVSAWSALYWKLYSRSLVVKCPSHWEVCLSFLSPSPKTFTTANCISIY